ncbi:MAG: hypothetical protein AAF577_13995 [Pseudomonadota bacterium]
MTAISQPMMSPFTEIPMRNKRAPFPPHKPALQIGSPGLLEVMREKDAEAFSYAAWWWDCYTLVRRSNAASRQYIGRPGFTAKPPSTKAKTAQKDVMIQVDGVPRRSLVAGLVANPHIVGRGPYASGAKFESAVKEWDKFVKTGRLLKVSWDGEGAPSRAYGLGVNGSFAVDLRRDSERYGALIEDTGRGFRHPSYINGDYDLFAIVSASHKKHNVAVEEQHALSPANPIRMVDGSQVPEHVQIKNYRGMEFGDVQRMLMRRMGVPMVLHGAQEKAHNAFDEELDVFFPDGRTCIYIEGSEEIAAFYRTELEDRRLYSHFDKSNPVHGRPHVGRWRVL